MIDCSYKSTLLDVQRRHVKNPTTAAGGRVPASGNCDTKAQCEAGSLDSNIVLEIKPTGLLLKGLCMLCIAR